MRSFTGSFAIRHKVTKDADHGIMITVAPNFVEAAKVAGKSCDENANLSEVLQRLIAAAASQKTGINKWSLYIPGVNETIPKGNHILPLSKVMAFLKSNEADKCTLTLGMGKFEPQLLLVGTVTGTKSGPTLF